jgi:hypothetical protein
LSLWIAALALTLPGLAPPDGRLSAGQERLRDDDVAAVVPGARMTIDL